MITSHFRRPIALVLHLLALASFPAEVIAADVRPYIHGSGAFRAIVVEGKIEPGDFETFVRIVRENQGKIGTVYIFSPGGNFYEAMKIGRAMRALELASQVPMRDPSGRPTCDSGFGPKPKDPKNCTCGSAGFFVHIGGVHRGGTYLAVHRPYFEKGEFGKLPQAEARKAFDALQQSARNYMQEMGVPKHIQEDVLGTPSDKALILDEKTLKTHFWLALPYRYEWLRNRCSKLSGAETERLKYYWTRSVADLSKTEREELEVLQKKDDEETKCEIEITRQSRVEAYKRYFGVRPTDYGSHNFAKWSDAPKYLGKRFYELLIEERFEEDKFGDSYFLRRSATASAPAINLSDSRSKPKVVTRINLVSPPNPSPEFIGRLVTSLENAWGNHSGGNGTTEWLWNQQEFSAKLVHHPVSAHGPFLSLVVKEK